MQGLFDSGRIVDLVLLVMLVEMIVLTVTRRMRALDVVTLMLPGACLVLALRAALVGAAWPVIAGALAAAFVAHLVDVVRRSTS